MKFLADSACEKFPKILKEDYHALFDPSVEPHSFIFYKENDEILSKGTKRTAPRGRGRGSTQSKRGRKSDNSAAQRMFMGQADDDDDDDDEDNTRKLLNKSQPRVSSSLISFYTDKKIVKYSFFTHHMVKTLSFARTEFA